MGPFRDYRRAIEAAARCCDAGLCAATRGQPALLRQVFQAIIERSWDPADPGIRPRWTGSARRPAPRCCEAPYR